MIFFHYESKFKIKKNVFLAGGCGGGGRWGGGARVSDFFSHRIQI